MRLRTSAWKPTISAPGRERQHEDAVGVDEPVAEVRELARQEAVAREQRGQPREALEGRVGGQREHAGRRRLHGVVAEGRAAGREHRTRDLRQHRDRLARPGVHLPGQERHAEEEEDRDHAHPQQRARGVARLRAPEGRHAVRDRLDAGQRAAARGEGAQQHDDDRRRPRGPTCAGSGTCAVGQP